MAQNTLHSQSSKLVFLNELPKTRGGGEAFGSVESRAQTLLVYDKRLLKVSPEFRVWSKSFLLRYAVEGGEDLKNLKKFPARAAEMASIVKSVAPRDLTVLAVGGGSVGDFAGFFASIFKRGVGLVHMPSTWLAALDSSHGGKTALNHDDLKNQFGTFYSAREVILVHSLLAVQPAERAIDAMGELGKIALIDGRPWVRKLEKTSLRGGDLIWKFLKPAIESKMRIVHEDPFERTGLRQVLNLGHTLGHVIEIGYSLGHGEAVAQGLYFALEFSHQRGLLSDQDFRASFELLAEKLGVHPWRPERPMRKSDFYRIALQDKKVSSTGKLVFLFLDRPGCVVRDVITVDTFYREARRQGWVQ